MVQGCGLNTRVHTGQPLVRGSVRLGPRHQAASHLWRRLQHSHRPLVAGGVGRTVLPTSTAQELPGQQLQRRRRQQQQQQQQQHERWLQTCQQVAAFQQQHGQLPRASAGTQVPPLLPGESSLGVWCTEQLRRKAGSKGAPLSAEEREALQAIAGWAWWSTQWVFKPWAQWQQEVAAFYQQHGRLPRSTAGQSTPFLPGENLLGRWVNRQRSQFRGRRQPPLSAERVAVLERTPGWSWGKFVNEPWEVRCQRLQDFARQHGRLPRLKAGSSSPNLPGEKTLGKWMDRQRQCYKTQMLSAEQIAALEATPGWCWEAWSLEAWESRLQQVQAFVLQHDRVPRARGSKCLPLQPSERELGAWCVSQRQRRKGTTHLPPLTAEQHAALAAVPGWFWDEADRWEQQRQQLEAFVGQHGRMPRTRPTRKGPLLVGELELGNWRAVQRERQRGASRRLLLTTKQLAAVEAIPHWSSTQGALMQVRA